MEEMEMILFELISTVGTAKSCFMEALSEAKEGNFEKAKELIKDGDKVFVEGHHKHLSLIQQEASGKGVTFSLLLLHAEDQLMSAENVKILCEEVIELYRKIDGKVGI